jgi:hypothetical protein
MRQRIDFTQISDEAMRRLACAGESPYHPFAMSPVRSVPTVLGLRPAAGLLLLLRPARS